MNKITLFRVLATLLVATGIILSLAGCGNGAQNAITVSYTTPFIPVTFSIDSSGNIGVSTGLNIVTEVGEFSVHVGSAISAFAVQANALVITIRHYENGNLVDTGYKINTGGVGSADIQGNINEVKVAWNGQNNTIFIDASNGDITSIVIQGNTSSTTSNVPAPVPTNPPVPPTSAPTFQCPDESQVSAWMSTNVNRVLNNDNCAFHGGDVSGQTLSGVICTNQDGGTSIEYTPVDAPNTLVIKVCDGGQLPEIYGFTIRFFQGYPSTGPYSANVCAIAAQAPKYLPSGWQVQAQANC